MRALLLLSFLGLAACGQAGDLYLPPEQPPVESTPPAGPAPAEQPPAEDKEEGKK